MFEQIGTLSWLSGLRLIRRKTFVIASLVAALLLAGCSLSLTAR